MSAATTFRRRVDFDKGYNYLHETGPRRRGQRGMSIRFLLVGPHGATQFVMQTMWTPLGPVDANAPGREPVHIDHWKSEDFGFGPTRFGHVRPPSGTDLGYHWHAPLYEGQEQWRREHCSYIGGPCYYDGSGLRADDLLRDFIGNGERAVWSALAAEYRSCLASEAEMTATQ